MSISTISPARWASPAGAVGRAGRFRLLDGRGFARRGRRHAPLARKHPPTRRPRLAHGRHAVDGHRTRFVAGHAAASVRTIAAVANGGHLLTPHVEKRGQNSFAEEKNSFDPSFSQDAARHSRGFAACGLRPARHGTCHGVSAHDRCGRKNGDGRDGRGSCQPCLVRRLCAGRVPNWRLLSCWSTAATRPRRSDPWSSGWYCGWISWACYNAMLDSRPAMLL